VSRTSVGMSADAARMSACATSRSPTTCEKVRLAAGGAARILGKLPKNRAETKDLATKLPLILGTLPKIDLSPRGCRL